MIHMILEHILQFMTSHYVFSLWGHLVENIVCRCGAAGLPECFGCSWKSRRGWIDCPSSRHRLQCFIYIRCSSPSRGTGKESLATISQSWHIFHHGSLDHWMKSKSVHSIRLLPRSRILGSAEDSGWWPWITLILLSVLLQQNETMKPSQETWKRMWKLWKVVAFDWYWLLLHYVALYQSTAAQV